MEDFHNTYFHSAY